jgi:Zn-dependent M28 family amino/carboxypeptidase
LERRLKRHVAVLAGEIGERNFWHPKGLEAAADYIAHVFRNLGYEVRREGFTVSGAVLSNLEATLVGTSVPGEIVVVGAHYDSVMGSPGANDNASGVAGLLETARLLAGRPLSRTVRFVAFVNEEPPFFQTDHMGSRVYASRSRQRGEQIVAMLSIETIGYYSEEQGSQRYPFPFGLVYPDTANFIGFVANVASRDLLRRAIATFREQIDFPSEGIAAPSWITGIGWSDHWSFWEEGYPALMVTDTALFRYRHYHTAQDTPDKIDYARMARVVTGITGVVAELTGPAQGHR